MNNQTSHFQKGVTLFFAMLVISLIFGIAVSISALSAKQIGISALVRQSEVAFYAADSGVECAQYYDLKKTPNVFDADPNVANTPSNGNTYNNQAITCAGASITVYPGNPDGNFSPTPQQPCGPYPDLCVTHYFTINYTISSTISACANVKVTKLLNSGLYSTLYSTQIESYGFSSACTGTPNNKRLERAIKVLY